MNKRWIFGAPAALLGGMLMFSYLQAAEPRECLRISVLPNGDAVLANVCSDVLNVMYCLDQADAGQSCAAPVTRVLSLVYGADEVLAGYTASGRPAIRSATCFYPEAPVQWRQEPDGTWACKKTCVMC